MHRETPLLTAADPCIWHDCGTRRLRPELSAGWSLRSGGLVSRPSTASDGRLRSRWLLYFAAVQQPTAVPRDTADGALDDVALPRAEQSSGEIEEPGGRSSQHHVPYLTWCGDALDGRAREDRVSVGSV